MNRPNPPECYQAPSEGTEPFNCPIINTVPHEDIIKWHNLMVDARENSIELLHGFDRIAAPDKSTRMVVAMYEEEIDDLTEAITNLQTYIL